MPKFEEYIEDCLETLQESNVKEACSYAIFAGGKRLRPRLLFSMLKAYGMEESVGYASAASLEMIHTYSLIHDDLPAMDNDDLRRGKPTVHIAYGEATAILAGDALLTLAFETILKSECSDAQKVQLVSYYSSYAGGNGMIYGQELDVDGEKKLTTTEEDLEQIHFYKTGKLFTLPLIAAAILANKQDDIETLLNVGKAIGLAFQIQDDVLDVTSTTDELGKPVGSDEENAKYTYTNLLGVDKSLAYANDLFQHALSLLSNLDIAVKPMKELITELEQRRK